MSAQRSFAAEMLGDQPDLRVEMEQSNLFQRLSSGLRTLKIDGESYFVAEGDTLLDEDQLLIYSIEREATARAREALAQASDAGIGRFTIVGGIDAGESRTGALLGIVQNGRLVRWRPGFVLTYCVLRQTFESQEQYELVRDNMVVATQDWESTCGVEFEYLPDLDASDTVRPDGVLFPVRGLDTGGAFIAAAFFPNDPVSRRRMIIDPSYFTTEFDKVGVLRHELGHVLGFRHEHIRSGAPPACPDEPLFGTHPITDYDPRSVMHYFCGGFGTNTLAISEVDRFGAQKVYGPPLNTFRLVG